MARVTIYVRAGCNKCRETEQLLRDQGHEIRRISVAGDATIMAVGSGATQDEHPLVFVRERRVKNLGMLLG